MTYLAGFDIGGTKCAVSIGKVGEDGSVEVLIKEQLPTPKEPIEALNRMMNLLEKHQQQLGIHAAAAGISCGGPLNSASGLILSPPNLPHWDRIDVITPIRERFNIPVGLQNDANACALAEWMWGAGRGAVNMIFLTFGTGMGAGLILNGRLYAGTNDMAGEVGHVRLEHEGPIGYGKAGSFEGFCSGGGIAKLAAERAKETLKQGITPLFCKSEAELDSITTKKVGEAAQAGDETALDVFRTVGRQLGRGLAMLIDILNPQMIVIGSIYGRQRQLLEPVVMETIRQEALAISAAACKVVPAGLGEQVGDYASLSVALNTHHERESYPQPEVS